MPGIVICTTSGYEQCATRLLNPVGCARSSPRLGPIGATRESTGQLDALAGVRPPGGTTALKASGASVKL